MRELLLGYQSELIGTAITLTLLLILRFVFEKTIRRVGRISDLHKGRTLLVIKYISIGLTTLGVVALILIWGVNIKDLGLIFSSAFAVVGVALFAQWSILSNVTAGIILFFSFPFKIGDYIKIMDKDVAADQDGYEVFMIEDIRAYHLYLRRSNNELITYPNNLILQKAVVLVDTFDDPQDDETSF